MKKRIKQVVTHPLISGGSTVFAGFFAANILNFVFNILMLRFLSKSDYGLLVTLSSFLLLLGIFQLSFQSTIAKFAAGYYAKKDKASLFALSNISFKVICWFAAALFVLLTILTPFFSRYLNVSNIQLLFLMYITLIFTIIFAHPNGILQGSLRFFTMSVLGFAQPFLKIILGVVLVIAGLKLFGAFLGIAIATIIATSLGYIYIQKEFKNQSQNIVSPKFFTSLFSYWRGFFVTYIGITILSSTDIILVRHFFTPEITGQYAFLSLTGKSIFYFTAPLNFAFFPIIAYKKENKENLLPTLFLGVGIVTLISSAVSFIYFLFPYFVISVFTFGKKGYENIAPYLGPFSLYILVFSVASLLNSFFLSIGKTKIYLFTIAAGILQIALIYVFHKNLFQIITSLFAISFLLTCVLLIYYILYGKD